MIYLNYLTMNKYLPGLQISQVTYRRTRILEISDCFASKKNNLILSHKMKSLSWVSMFTVIYI